MRAFQRQEIVTKSSAELSVCLSWLHYVSMILNFTVTRAHGPVEVVGALVGTSEAVPM